MIRRQGVPVPVLRTSSLVQSLWGQKSLNANDTRSNDQINSFMHYGTAIVKISYTLEWNLHHCTGGSWFWHESDLESQPQQWTSDFLASDGTLSERGRRQQNKQQKKNHKMFLLMICDNSKSVITGIKYKRQLFWSCCSALVSVALSARDWGCLCIRHRTFFCVCLCVCVSKGLPTKNSHAKSFLNTTLLTAHNFSPLMHDTEQANAPSVGLSVLYLSIQLP